jgi:hypothetical protein
MQAEAGDDLVEHKQRTIMPAHFLNALEIAGSGRIERDRLHDHAGDLITVLPKDIVKSG